MRLKTKARVWKQQNKTTKTKEDPNKTCFSRK